MAVDLTVISPHSPLRSFSGSSPLPSPDALLGRSLSRKPLEEIGSLDSRSRQLNGSGSSWRSRAPTTEKPVSSLRHMPRPLTTSTNHELDQATPPIASMKKSFRQPLIGLRPVKAGVKDRLKTKDAGIPVIARSEASVDKLKAGGSPPTVEATGSAIEPLIKAANRRKRRSDEMAGDKNLAEEKSERKRKTVAVSPLNITKAVPRKAKRTLTGSPTKSTHVISLDTPSDTSIPSQPQHSLVVDIAAFSFENVDSISTEQSKSASPPHVIIAKPVRKPRANAKKTTTAAGDKSAPAEPKKRVSSAKKLTTLTALATSDYRVPEPSPLSQYFTTQQREIAADRQAVAEAVKLSKPVRKKAPTTGVAKKRVPTKKAAANEAAKPLSPDAAQQLIQDQHIVFGTSSQLLRGDRSRSATHSSDEAEAPSTDFDYVDLSTRYPSRTEHGLWGASSRVDESLLEIDEEEFAARPSPRKEREDAAVQMTANTAIVDESFETLPRSSSPARRPPTPEPTQPLAPSPHFDDPEPVSVLTSEDEPIASKRPASRGKKTAPQPKTPASPKKKAVVRSTLKETKPDYGAWTAAQLTKEVAKLGFKAIKARKNQVALLERCWEQQQSRLQTEANIPATQIPATKSTAGGVTPASQSSNAAPLETQQMRRSRLLSCITAAVKAQQPVAVDAATATKPRPLTWYEKMLCYDPIILEDFTAWLNTGGGFAAVNCDDEVLSGLVKDWCDKNGVTRIWRETIRGGPRRSAVGKRDEMPG